MWIPKGAALISGRRLFEARRLLEEMRYVKNLPKRKLNRLASHVIQIGKS